MSLQARGRGVGKAGHIGRRTWKLVGVWEGGEGALPSEETTGTGAWAL